MSDMTYVINTFSYIWRHPVQQCIAHLADQGYREFEVLLTAPHLWPVDFDAQARRGLAQALQQRGARIVSLNAGGFDNNLASPAENVRAFARNYLTATIDLAADLGVGDIVMAPGIGRPLMPPPREQMLSWFHGGMDILVRHAQARGVRLLLENIPFSFLPRIEGLVAAIAGYPADRVGIVYDAANAVFVREDPAAGLAHAAARLHLVHLSDTPLDVWRHDAVGTGVVPFERIGVALRELGYNGPVVLEIIAADPDRDIRESISTLARSGW